MSDKAKAIYDGIAAVINASAYEKLDEQARKAIDAVVESQVPAPDVRWSLQTLLGIVVLVGAAFCYQFGLDVAAPMLQVVGTTLAALGDRLPLMTGKTSRGFARLGLLAIVGALAALGLLLSGGCASAERNGETMTVRVERDPLPATTCHYRHLLDGEVIDEGELAVCPVVPVCEVPK